MTTWVFTIPTARKTHRCDDCHREITPGEMYERAVGFEGGTPREWKRCEHCRWAVRNFPIGESDEVCLEDWDDPWDIREARAIAGFRSQWRTQSGALWPLPEKVKAA